MKKCSEGHGIMQGFTDKTLENGKYTYHKCKKYGNEIVDMKQLHHVASFYK